MNTTDTTDRDANTIPDTDPAPPVEPTPAEPEPKKARQRLRLTVTEAELHAVRLCASYAVSLLSWNEARAKVVEGISIDACRSVWAKASGTYATDPVCDAARDCEAYEVLVSRVHAIVRHTDNELFGTALAFILGLEPAALSQTFQDCDVEIRTVPVGTAIDHRLAPVSGDVIVIPGGGSLLGPDGSPLRRRSGNAIRRGNDRG